MDDFQIIALPGWPHNARHGVESILKERGFDPPGPEAKVLKCQVTIPVVDRIPQEDEDLDGATAFLAAKAWSWGRYVFVSGAGDVDLNFYNYEARTSPPIEESDPFIQIRVLEKPYHKKVLKTEYEGHGGWPHYNRRERQVEALDTYNDHYDHTLERTVPGDAWNYMRVRITVGGATVDTDLRFTRPNCGLLDINALTQTGLRFQASINLFGLPLTWEEVAEIDQYGRVFSEAHQWEAITRLLNEFTIVQGKDALWDRFFQRHKKRAADDKGVKGAEGKKGIKENLARLAAEEPLLFAFYGWLHEGKTNGGTSNNTLLSAFLLSAGADYDALKGGLRDAMEQAPGKKTITRNGKGHRGFYSWNYVRAKSPRDICLDLPGAKQKNEDQRAKREWNFRKGAREQAIGLGISPDIHPLLLAAIEANEISLGIFHKHGDEMALVNVEFDLWERAFAQPGWKEVIVEIAQNASKRSTYEKDITPYLAFLFRLPKYLDRHTEAGGTPWKAMPKFVKSEWELEMNEAEGETTKRRSALTPVADNKARVVTVPYVAMAIHGIQTTYCYSLDYQVFEENDVDRESKTIISRELETKLNGRDDYGLMYYTLTGSARNTGYPAFLIIFERMKSRGKTRVHFHRVHPCRSKEGRPTPACRLVEECYRYMAGNVRAEEIHAQQGDLIFIKTDQKIDVPDDAKNVKEFESHAFVPLEEGQPIKLVENTNKSVKNRLGFLVSGGVFSVRHPEHENIKALPAGIYDVRRCKSWEANPKAVWVLTID